MPALSSGLDYFSDQTQMVWFLVHGTGLCKESSVARGDISR